VAADLFADQRVDAWRLPLDPTVPRPRNATARPSGASTIPTPDDPDYDSEVGYTTLASFAGLPAISFPVGRCGVPVAPLAMQLVGPRHSERSLIGLADAAARRLDLPEPRLR
jgi:Asp-tRNA(Asn)/Glu-tRNA(Gln) amidotransferase A subunit family amidase